MLYRRHIISFKEFRPTYLYCSKSSWYVAGDKPLKAVLFDEKGFVNLEGATKPQIKTSNGAVVKIMPMVICDSDMNILKSQIMIEINGIMGREGVGVI